MKNLLKRRTERDKQIRVGASNISNPCTRCLAEDLYCAGNSMQRPQGPYNMGAIVGTAIHDYLEKRNLDETALCEHRVTLGTIPGYGTIKSTTDLFLRETGTVVDFKTTTRNKLKNFIRAGETEPSDLEVTSVSSARTTLERYFFQAQLYGMGMENAGETVNHVSIVFVCRDGQIVDRDVYGLTRAYSRDTANMVFDRTARIYQWLQEGNDPSELPSRDDCYYCSVLRRDADHIDTDAVSL